MHSVVPLTSRPMLIRALDRGASAHWLGEVASERVIATAAPPTGANQRSVAVTASNQKSSPEPASTPSSRSASQVCGTARVPDLCTTGGGGAQSSVTCPGAVCAAVGLSSLSVTEPRKRWPGCPMPAQVCWTVLLCAPVPVNWRVRSPTPPLLRTHWNLTVTGPPVTEILL